MVTERLADLLSGRLLWENSVVHERVVALVSHEEQFPLHLRNATVEISATDLGQCETRASSGE